MLAASECTIAGLAFSSQHGLQSLFFRLPSFAFYLSTRATLESKFMLTKRSSGILMHPTSLPSRGGIGDLVRLPMNSSIGWLPPGRPLWQVLPFGPVGYGNSPYSCTSAFAGNVLMISLRAFGRARISRSAVGCQLLRRQEAASISNVCAQRKLPLLREAARNFLRTAQGRARERYETF